MGCLIMMGMSQDEEAECVCVCLNTYVCVYVCVREGDTHTPVNTFIGVRLFLEIYSSTFVPWHACSCGHIPVRVRVCMCV